MNSPTESTSGWRSGSQVGEWILGRKLGAGGMGIVFAARHLATQVEVAIKVLASDVDPEILARFQREGEAQARVDDHPAILRIHAAGRAWGRPYLVLEYAPGGDLAARLRRGPLPPERARALLSQVAGGVEHLHRAGILHRDLKPENVLFDSEDRPRLTDFGLARFAGAQSLTETGTVLGTPTFMAPEQAKGLTPDARTDVYALGALLFASLTGRSPIEGPSVLVVLTRVIEDTPPPPSSLESGVPPDLDAVCAGALAKDPSERYSSAAEFAEALLASDAPRSGLFQAGALAGAGLLAILAVGLVAAFSRPPAPALAPPSPRAQASQAPSQSASPRQVVRRALDPTYLRGRVVRRAFYPDQLAFVAPGRLLTRKELPEEASGSPDLLELWEVGLDGEPNKVWEERETRSAVFRGGRLFWLEINHDHSLVLQASTTFKAQSEAYPDCALQGKDQVVYVSPRGRYLAWRETIDAHYGTLRLYDLEGSKLEPFHERSGVNVAWLGDSALATTRFGDREQAFVEPAVCVDHFLAGELVSGRTRPLKQHPMTVWGSESAVWVGLSDGSLLEVPHETGRKERTYAHAPAGRRGPGSRGSRVRGIRSANDYLFATTHSDKTPSHSQLVAWRRGKGVSSPVEVFRFPKRSRPAILSLDPRLGLIAVAVDEAREGGLWILRLHD